MRFRDRRDAGRQLAQKLSAFKNKKNGIVLGLPRGGVVTAAEVAKALHLPLDIVVIRKMGAPGNRELAIGAVDEQGEGPLNPDVIESLGVTEAYIKSERSRAKGEATRYLTLFQNRRKSTALKNKITLLVDDGLATGATMRAAVHSVKAKGAKKVIVAIPVGAPDSIEALRKEVDDIIYLDAPPYFGAVGAFYEIFDQTSDEEVIQLLKEN